MSGAAVGCMIFKAVAFGTLAACGIVSVGITIVGGYKLYKHFTKPEEQKVVTFVDYQEVKSQATVANKNPSDGCILRNRKNVEGEKQTSLSETKSFIHEGEKQASLSETKSIIHEGEKQASLSETKSIIHEGEKQKDSAFVSEIKPNVVPGDDVMSDTSSVRSDSTTSSDSSTSTLIEEIDVDENFTTWSDMNDEERRDAKCVCCFGEAPIQTVFAVCDHPYACKICAESLSKDYRFCPLCHAECISGETAYKII